MIRDYLRVIGRRWYVIPALLLVAGGVLLFATTRAVTVTSRVVVPYPGDQNELNYQGIAQSLSVAKAVLHDSPIHGMTPTKLLAEVVVTQEYGTNIYDISVKDSSKPRALRICNDWVKETNVLYARVNTAPSEVAFTAAAQNLSQTQQTIDNLEQQITAFEYAHPELINLQTTTSSNGTQRNSSSQTSSSNYTNSSATNGSTTTAGQSAASTPGNSSTSGQTGTSSRTNGASTGYTNNSSSSSLTSSGTTSQVTNHTQGNVTDAQQLAGLQQQLANQQVMYYQLAQVVGTSQANAVASADKTTAQLLDPAVVPSSNIPLLAAFTVLLGLLVGLGLIFAWEYFDHSMHNSSPLEDAFGTVVVTNVSKRPGRRELERVAPVAWAIPASSVPTTQRPGHWPTMFAIAALAAATIPVTTAERDGVAGNIPQNGQTPG